MSSGIGIRTSTEDEHVDDEGCSVLVDLEVHGQESRKDRLESIE